MMEPSAASGMTTQLKDWVPVAAAVLALIGIVINVTLTWRLGRHKAQSEKTWEKRREVYTELLKKLRVIVGIVYAQEDMRRHAIPEQFSEAMSKSDFKDSVSELRIFVEDNILYISKEMEEAFQLLWGAFDSIYKRTGGRAIGERTPPDQQQQSFFVAATKVNDAVKSLAQKEIRVPSV